MNGFCCTRKRERTRDGTDLERVSTERLDEKSEFPQLLVNVVEYFLFLFGKVYEFREQEFLAVLGDVVLERFHGLFEKHARVGRMLVDNQETVGIFACDVGVCNLEKCWRCPRNVLWLFRLREVVLKRNNLAIFGQRKQVLDIVAYVVLGAFVRERACGLGWL